MRWEQIQQLIVLRELESDRARLLRQGWMPAVDLYETADRFVVTIELPGLAESDFDLHVASDSVTLRGRRQAPQVTPHEYHQLERAHGPFQRRFTFAQPIDTASTVARFEDGVLTITVPKAGHVGPRRVDVA